MTDVLRPKRSKSVNKTRVESFSNTPVQKKLSQYEQFELQLATTLHPKTPLTNLSLSRQHHCKPIIALTPQ